MFLPAQKPQSININSMANNLTGGVEKVSAEVGRAFLEYANAVNQPRLQAAGHVVQSGLALLEPLEWATLSRLDANARRVFGDCPEGPARIQKMHIPYILDADSYEAYLGWCSKHPVNVPGIMHSTFLASLAVEIEKLGGDFVEELNIKPYTFGQRDLDNHFFLWNLGGGHGCLDREPYGTFGGCLDRGPY